MSTMDFVQKHRLAAKICGTGVSPDSVWGTPDGDGIRTSIWGDRLHDRDYAAFLQQCAITLQAVNQKAQIVAAWRREKGTTT